jgi:pimeloyl-ACP methyl ester carboxylesterase
MEIEGKIVQVGGLNINYYQQGEQGSPVVFLHGGGTDSALLSWRHAIPALAAEHRVFAPDWPGYGQSDCLDEPYTMVKLVDTLDGLLTQWGLERASLVGLSMGGGAAIAYTLAHPDRVDRLILADTYGIQRKAPGHFTSYLYIKFPIMVRLTWNAVRRDKAMVRSVVRAIFADQDNLDDALVDEIFEAVQDRKGETSFYSFQKYEMTLKGLRTNYVSRLPEIKSPTLFIHGDTDKLVPVAEIRQVVSTMPAARLEVMERTGHWPPREHPEQFNQLVLDFLRP